MAGLLDSDADREEYLRRLQARPMIGSWQRSPTSSAYQGSGFDDWRYERALTGLRDELLREPAMTSPLTTAHLADLSLLSQPGPLGSEFNPAGSQPNFLRQPGDTGPSQADLTSRLTGMPTSSNIVDLRPSQQAPSAAMVAQWLQPETDDANPWSWARRLMGR